MTGTTDHGRYSWRLFPLALAMLLPSLGTSIANVALPSFESAFEAPLGEVQWVVLSYLLAVTTLIVGVGGLGDLVGRRLLLLGGIGLFALASAGAALAPALWVLIAARAAQGIGAAIMMALTVALVSDVVPKDRTGGAMGLLGTVSAVGTALGPSLGGALLSWASWPALFAMLGGAGTLTFLMAIPMLPANPAGQRKNASFDLPGMILLASALGAYALSTTLGGAHPGLLNAGLAVLAVVIAGAFVAFERITASPLLTIERLAGPGLGAGLLSMGLISTIMMATLVVGPFYLSEVLHFGSVQTGLVMSIGPAVAALVGFPAGRLVDALGSKRIMIIGLSGVVIGALMMTVLPGRFGAAGYVAALVLITAGYALFQAANNTAVMEAAAQDQRGLTSALLGLSRNLGLITGASAMGAVFALGSSGVAAINLAAGRETGLLLTFGLATLLASLALAIIARPSGGLRP